MTILPTGETDLTLTRNIIDAGLRTFVSKQILDAQTDLENREQVIRESIRQLEEAKQAAPALFAKPGDMFEWLCPSEMYNESFTEPCVLEYLGRNETAPIPIELSLSGIDFIRSSPEVGWLVFRHVRGRCINEAGYGIRYALDAFPQALFQHYNSEGQADESTICIPPSMCGSLRINDGD